MTNPSSRASFPFLRATLLAAPLLLTQACGRSEPPPAVLAAPAVAAEGLLDLSLVRDGLAPGFSALKVVITGVDVEVGGVWRPVPLDAAETGPQTVDLLGLSSASPGILATKVPWPAGANDKVRLTFGPGSTATPAGGDQTQDLIMPAEMIGPMALPGSFSVEPGKAKVLILAMDVSNAVLADPADPSRWVFKPMALRAYDRSATGVIKGRLATGPGAAALGGVTVTAQLQRLRGQDGSALIFRTVQSDPSGQFTLDLLPLGFTWCAVSQPVATDQAYGAIAAEGAALGLAPYDQAVRNLDAPPAAAAGTLQGTLAGPYAAGQVNVVDLVQTFVSGGNPYPFTVASVAVVPDGAEAPAPGGTFRFEGVPPGTYEAVLNRYGYDPGAGATRQRYPTAPFDVRSGETVSIRF